MQKSRVITDDYQFILFREVYDQLPQLKAKRVAAGLLNSAIDCFANKGINHCTHKMVARHCGVMPQKLTYYLGDIDSIIMLAIKYTRFLYQKYVVDEISQQKTVVSSLSVYFDTCFAWPELFPSHTRLWLAVLSIVSEQKNAALSELNSEATKVGLARLVALIDQGRESKEFLCAESIEVAICMHTLITGQLLAEATERNELTLQKRKVVIKHCWDLLEVNAKCSSESSHN